MNIILYSLAYPVTCLGPGTRVVLWVAGCRKECPGCLSPEMKAPGAGKAVPVDVLLRRLLRLDPEINGMTISGGEPFDQAEALAELLARVRRERPEWTVISYTGDILDDLRRDTARRAKLLDYVDVLIDGPFRRDIAPNHPLAGSGNQAVHGITPRGQTMLPEMAACPPQQVNLGLGAGPLYMIIGVVEEEARDALRGALQQGSGDACACENS